MVDAVIPVYNSAECLPELAEQLIKYLSEISTEYQIIFVEDQSTDNSLSVLKNIQANHPEHVQLIAQVENLGQMTAIYTGLKYSKAEYTFVLDGDLEHPPKFLPDMYSKLENADMLIAVRKKHKQYNMLRQVLRYFYMFRFSFSPYPNRDRWTTFSLIRKPVRQALLESKYRNRFYVLGLESCLDRFKAVFFSFDEASRPYGKSSYTIRKLLKLVFNQ